MIPRNQNFLSICSLTKIIIYKNRSALLATGSNLSAYTSSISKLLYNVDDGLRILPNGVEATFGLLY